MVLRRLVQTAGDGLLAEFPSALSALRASVQIQREMASRLESEPGYLERAERHVYAGLRKAGVPEQ